MLASDFVFGIGNRWANRHTGGLDTYQKGRRFIHVDIEPTQIGRVFAPDFGIMSDAKAALEQFVAVAKERRAAGTLPDWSTWVQDCEERKRSMHRKTHFDDIPIKPQRVYEEMNRVFGRDVRYVTAIGLSQIAGGQFLQVYEPRNWINCGQAGPLGWTVPAALGVVAADPGATVVGLSGDYDFQFLIEELAVGAQFNLPYVHVVVNNSYLGLIRQAQRAFDMDYFVSLAFDNINAQESGDDNMPKGYGVDHLRVVEGLGCKAIQVVEPQGIGPALERAQQLAHEHKVPVVVEIFLERVTNIAIGHRDRQHRRIQRSRRNTRGRTDGRGTAAARLDRGLFVELRGDIAGHAFQQRCHFGRRLQRETRRRSRDRDRGQGGRVRDRYRKAPDADLLLTFVDGVAARPAQLDVADQRVRGGIRVLIGGRHARASQQRGHTVVGNLHQQRLADSGAVQMDPPAHFGEHAHRMR